MKRTTFSVSFYIKRQKLLGNDEAPNMGQDHCKRPEVRIFNKAKHSEG